MGITTDQEIFDLIVYDKEDDAFSEMLIPSVEEGAQIQTVDVSIISPSHKCGLAHLLIVGSIGLHRQTWKCR